MSRRIIILIGIVFVVFAGYYYLLLHNEEEGKEREVRIIAEYQAIKHPKGANLVSYEVGRKFIMRWVSSKYTYSISNDDRPKVLEAYQRVMNKTTTLYAVWPGNRSSDLFIIDDLDAFAKAFNFI